MFSCRALSGLTRLDVALTQSGLAGSPCDDGPPIQDLRRSSVPAFPLGIAATGSADERHRWPFNVTATQTSNKVPSRSMACMMTASRRARATRALRNPRRLAIFRAQRFNAKS